MKILHFLKVNKRSKENNAKSNNGEASNSTYIDSSNNCYPNSADDDRSKSYSRGKRKNVDDVDNQNVPVDNVDNMVETSEEYLANLLTQINRKNEKIKIKKENAQKRLAKKQEKNAKRQRNRETRREKEDKTFFDKVFLKLADYYDKLLESASKSELRKEILIVILSVVFLIVIINYLYSIRITEIKNDFHLRLTNGIYETLNQKKEYVEEVLSEFYYKELYYAEDATKIDEKTLIQYLVRFTDSYAQYDNIYVVTKDLKQYIANEGTSQDFKFLNGQKEIIYQAFEDGGDEYLYLAKEDVFSNTQILKKFRNYKGKVVCLVGLNFNYTLMNETLEKYRNLGYPNNIFIEDEYGKIFYSAFGANEKTRKELEKACATKDEIERGGGGSIDEIIKRKGITPELVANLDRGDLKEALHLENGRTIFTYSESSWIYLKDVKLKIGVINTFDGIRDNMYYGTAQYVLIEMLLIIMAIKYLLFVEKRKNFRQAMYAMGILIGGTIIVFHMFTVYYGKIKNIKNGFNSLVIMESVVNKELQSKEVADFIYAEEKESIDKDIEKYKGTDLDEPIAISNLSKNILFRRKDLIDYNIKVVKSLIYTNDDEEEFTIINYLGLYNRYKKLYDLPSDSVKKDKENSETYDETTYQIEQSNNNKKILVDIYTKNTALEKLNTLVRTFDSFPSRFDKYGYRFNFKVADDSKRDKQSGFFNNIYISNKGSSVRYANGIYEEFIPKVKNHKKVYEYENMVLYLEEDSKIASVHYYINSNNRYTSKEVVYEYNFIDYTKGLIATDVICTILLVIVMEIAMYIYYYYIKKHYDYDADMKNEKEKMEMLEAKLDDLNEIQSYTQGRVLANRRGRQRKDTREENKQSVSFSPTDSSNMNEIYNPFMPIKRKETNLDEQGEKEKKRNTDNYNNNNREEIIPNRLDDLEFDSDKDDEIAIDASRWSKINISSSDSENQDKKLIDKSITRILSKEEKKRIQQENERKAIAATAKEIEKNMETMKEKQRAQKEVEEYEEFEKQLEKEREEAKKKAENNSTDDKDKDSDKE